MNTTSHNEDVSRIDGGNGLDTHTKKMLNAKLTVQIIEPLCSNTALNL